MTIELTGVLNVLKDGYLKITTASLHVDLNGIKMELIVTHVYSLALLVQMEILVIISFVLVLVVQEIVMVHVSGLLLVVQTLNAVAEKFVQTMLAYVLHPL